MITQSDKAIEAWKATERVLDAIVSINGTDYKTTDITSIEYDSGAFTGDTFAIGSNYENSVTIKFSHLVEGLKQGQKVTVKIGIETSDGTYEYSPLGVFIVSDDIEMDRNNDETTIKCYDQMCLMEGNYTSKLTYPAKVLDVIAEIANMVGVVLNTDELARLPSLGDLPSAIKEQTYRNAIGWIAQFYAGFATFDRDGKLTIRTVTEPDYTLDPSQYEQGGLTKNEATYKIGGIQCEVTTSTTDSTGESTDETVTLQVGDSTGSQIKLSNNLMTQSRLDIIWSKLKNITFYPFSLSWFGNPAIEAGDWLTLQDTKGNKFNVPNNSYTMTFDGSLSATSKADQTSTASSSYSWNGELSQVVKQIYGRLTSTGNFIYGPDTTQEPTGAKFNDLWYKQNGNKLEMWTFERQSDGSGKWKLTVSDSTGVEVKASVDAAHQEAQTAITNANTAITQADTAIQQAGFANTAATQAQDIANDAKVSSGTALQRAQQALATGNTNSTDITNVSKDLSDAKTGLQTQITDNKNNINDTTANLATVSKDLNTTKSNLQTVSDQATQNGKNINTTNNTVNGIKTDLANTKGDVTELQTTASGLSADMVNAKGDISSLKTKAGSLESSMSTVTGDISTLKQTTGSLSSQMSGKVDNTVYQSDKTQTANSISSVVATVNNLGVVNLLTGTANELVTKQNITSNHWDIGNISTGNQPIIQGQVYTYRAYISNCDVNTRVVFYGWDSSGKQYTHGGNTISANSSGYSTVTFTAEISFAKTNPSIGFLEAQSSTHSIIYKEPKLEKGTVATPWSPAPSDKANQTDFSATQQTVNGLTTTVASHTGDISSLKQTATTMQSDIKDNADNISSVKQTASSLSSQMQNKVDTSTYTSDKTQTAKDIASKVAQTDFDTLKGTVTSQGTTISQNSKDIALKANTTDVNTLTGRVSTAEANINTNAKAITSKVSASNVTNMLTPYATQSYTQSAITQSANSINSTVSSLQNQVNNSAVGTNLLAGTGDSKNIVGNNITNQCAVTYKLADSLNVYQLYQQYGGTFTLSYDWVVTGSTTSGSAMQQWNNLPWGISDKITVSSSNKSGHQETTFTVGNSSSNTATALEFRLDNFQGTLTISNVKLEKGKVATDYSANPADNATVTALSSVSQKADSISTTVTNNKTSSDSQFSTINQKITGVQSTVANKADSSTVTQLNTLVQSKVNTSDYNSTVSQLSSNIDLRVTKSGVINAVNISSEGIQIFGNKLHITSTTYIDNAVIKSAMIDSITADKITAGTLNAAKVNVVNLNAANITSGTLSGANLSMNLDNGTVMFQKGSIKSTNGTLDIEISDGTMSVTNTNSEGILFKNGKMVLSSKNAWSGVLNWLNGGSSVSASYGAIEQGVGIAMSGIAIHGQGGASLLEDKNGKATVVDTGFHNISNGGGIGVSYNSVIVGGDTSYITYITSGTRYGSVLSVQPVVTVGTAAWNYNGSTSPGQNVEIAANGFWVHTEGAQNFNSSGKVTIDASNGLDVTHSIYTNGTLKAAGAKNSIVPTSQGIRAINAYETAEYYFGDIGESQTAPILKFGTKIIRFCVIMIKIRIGVFL